MISVQKYKILYEIQSHVSLQPSLTMQTCILCTPVLLNEGFFSIKIDFVYPLGGFQVMQLLYSAL